MFVIVAEGKDISLGIARRVEVDRVVGSVLPVVQQQVVPLAEQGIANSIQSMRILWLNWENPLPLQLTPLLQVRLRAMLVQLPQQTAR